MNLRQAGYWDEHYELELKNYTEHGDEGEVWFGTALRKRIVDWLVKRLISRTKSSTTSRVLDIGCGNAFTIYTLVEKCKSDLIDCASKFDNYKFLGLDHSINSINLSRKIVAEKGLNNIIDIEQCDFLNLHQLRSVCKDEKFDFAVDIGTYDAICLMTNESTISETKLKYMESLYSLMDSGSIFILASCNHTEEELLCLFSMETFNRLEAKKIDRIETPNLQFGGKVGSQVTCLAMKFAE